jgi:hypothetical protein
MLLVVVGHDHDLETTITTVCPWYPVRVKDLHPSCLFACTRHDTQLSEFVAHASSSGLVISWRREQMSASIRFLDAWDA